MSASSIADRATPADPSTRTASTSATKDALASIAAYIPSEGIALYIAIASLGIAAGVSYWNWVALGLGLGANGFVFSYRFVQNSAAANQPTPWGRMFYLLAVTGTLTAVYISAIAGNPFQSMTPISALVSGTLVVIIAFLVPFIAPLIGLEATASAPATVQPTTVPEVRVRTKGKRLDQ